MTPGYHTKKYVIKHLTSTGSCKKAFQKWFMTINIWRIVCYI